MFAFLLGEILKLDFKSILLIAILFTFNSTAVVVEFMKKHGTLHTAFGTIILNILLLGSASGTGANSAEILER